MNDIALLKLPNPITFTREIQPVGLPKGDYANNGTKTTVVGWVTLRVSIYVNLFFFN